MLEQDGLNVLFAQADAQQRPDQEDMRVGATRDSDALTLQIRDCLDIQLFACNQRSPFRLGVDVDRFDRVAIDLCEQRCRTGGRSEVDRARVEKFQRFIRAS